MEKLIFFGPIVLSVLLALLATYFIYGRTKNKKLGLLPTLILLVIGLGFMIVGYIVAYQDSDAWIGLAMLILALVLFLTILTSTLLSLFLCYLMDKGYIKPPKTKVKSSSTK